MRLEASKNNLRAVSTDGCRMLIIDLPFECDQKFDALISRAHVIRIARSVEHDRVKYPPGPLSTMEFDRQTKDVPGTLKITIGIVTLTIPCVNAEFPPYDQVIPKPLELDTKGLRKTEKCVALQTKYLVDAHLINTRLGNDDNHGVKLQVGESCLDPIRCDFDAPCGIKAVMILMPMSFK